jgi:hypothetical protein
MIDELPSAVWIPVVAALCADFALLRRRPFNLTLVFAQLTFSATTIGATLLAETSPGAVVIVLLGATTKVLMQALFWRFAPALAASAEEGVRAVTSARLYVAASLIVLPLYAFLVLRGGLGWFESMDLRVDYTAENGIALRAVRHWTPMLVFWALLVVRRERAEPNASEVTRERFSVVALLAIQLVAFALLEGSKSAAVVLLFATAGAAQLTGFRIPKRLAAPAAAGAVVLLVYFLSIVAEEWSFSISDAFALRMVSGSQGLLFAVEPPDGKYCSVETFWFPIANFFSKAFAQGPLAGYTSMGHCLAAADPSYPWELLVPLLAAAYHVSPWAAPLVVVAYVAFALAVFAAVSRLVSAARVEEVRFPVAYFVAFQLFTVLTHGKLTNFIISELVSVAAFVGFVAFIKKVLTAADDAVVEEAPEARG